MVATVSRRGLALIFTIAMLALVSILGMAFVTASQVDRSIAGNYVLLQRVKMHAETGVADAFAVLAQLPPNSIISGGFQMPFPDPMMPPLDPFNPPPRILESTPVTQGGYTVRVMDESGRLNLNNPNTDGTLERIVRALMESLQFGPAECDAVAQALFYTPGICRQSYGGDQFPSMAAVERCLRAAGLDASRMFILRSYCTLYSWKDPNVIRTNARRYGSQRNGVSLTADDGEPVATWLEFQTAQYELEPRAPVNLNTAPVALLYALILPIQGVFLEERNQEYQSTEHYGWWSTGMGAPDPYVNVMGYVRQTRPFTPSQAMQLAQAIYDRVHGNDNPDVKWSETQDPILESTYGNRFETWEEFREFLQNGLEPAADEAIFGGGGDFGVTPTQDIVRPYDAGAGFADPHTLPPVGGDNDSTYRMNCMNNGISLVNAGGLPGASWDTSQVVSWWNQYYTQAQRDAVYANFNPNSLLNDFNPNANLYLMVDKAQLTQSTTEGCLDSTGAFSINSRASIENPATGETLAAYAIRTVVEVFVPYRLTSQAQFLAGMRDAEMASEYFSGAIDSGGQAEAHMTSAGRLSLQSYPEPLLFGKEAFIYGARYDGYLMPATLELKTLDSASQFMASFNGDSDRPLEIDRLPVGAAGDRQPHQDAHNRIHDGAVLRSAEDDGSVVPGSVYPDGVYSESERVYAVKMGNFNPAASGNGARQGSLNFWVKPNFSMGIASRIRKFMCGPSRAGVYGRQVFPALYFLPNAASNETIGRLGNGDSPLGLKRTFTLTPQLSQQGLGFRNYWVPTRSLAFGFAWQQFGGTRRTYACGSVASPTVCSDYAMANNQIAAAALDAGSLHAICMPGRQWTRVHVAWNANTAMMSSKSVYLGIGFRSCHIGSSSGPRNIVNSPYQNILSVSWTDNFNMEWLRFGELPPQSANGIGSPYAADATFDEIWGWRDCRPWNFNDIQRAPRYGRYYSVSQIRPGGAIPYVGCYTTPEIVPSRELHLSGRVRLRGVAWTLYRAPHNRTERHALNADSNVIDSLQSMVVNPNDNPDPLGHRWAADVEPDHEAWDPISVDFRLPIENAGDTERWYYDDDNRETERMTDPAGSLVGDPAALAAATYAPGEGIRLRVYFHFYEPNENMVYEAPVLDDITLTFALSSHRVLMWQGGPDILAEEAMAMWSWMP